jgi:ribosomal protein S18 acetylase RimI-like enzyme
MPIRIAQIDDARQIAEIQVTSWRAAYRGMLADVELESLSVEKSTELWRERLSEPGEAISLVLVLGDHRAGWMTVGSACDSDCNPQQTQRVYAIYLRPEYWGQGHGKELYLAGEDQMRKTGAVAAVLWVLRDNVRARRFYEAQGFSLDGSERCHEGDPEIVEVRYRKVFR